MLKYEHKPDKIETKTKLFTSFTQSAETMFVCAEDKKKEKAHTYFVPIEFKSEALHTAVNELELLIYS